MYEFYPKYELVNATDLVITANEGTGCDQLYHINVCTYVKIDIGKKGCIQKFFWGGILFRNLLLGVLEGDNKANIRMSLIFMSFFGGEGGGK